MKKLYGGIAAAALVVTGVTCGAGSAVAVAPAGPLPLGFTVGGGVSTIVSTAGDQVYTVAVDNADPTQLDVATTTIATGETTHATLELASTSGSSITGIASLAVAATGRIVVSATQSDEEVTDNGVWTAQVGDTVATETFSVPAAGTVAISRNGAHAALAAGADLYAFAPSDSLAPSVTLGEEGDSVWAAGVAVTDTGDVYVAGDDFPAGGDGTSTPLLWTLPEGSGTPSTRELAAEPQVVTLAGSNVVVGESDQTSQDGSSPLQVFDATVGAPVTGRIPQAPHLLTASSDGGTVWASDGGSIVRVDLDSLSAYTTANPAPSAYPGFSIAALAAGDGTLYGVDTPSHEADGDSEGSNWVSDPATLFALGTPAPVTDAMLTDYNQADQDTPGLLVNWTDPADANGSLSYLVTATDKAAPHDSITVMGSDGGVFLDSDSGIVLGDHYDVSVRTFNGGFLSDTVAALPALPDATVSVAGDTSVGSTLTASVHGWDSGVSKSYQWVTATDDNEGNTVYTPIKDQTNATLVIGAGLLHKQLAVQVTGTKDGFAATQAVSDTVGPVTAAVVKQPALSGQGHVSVSGSGTVGSVLTAHVTGNWPATATLSYQWFYNGGQFGGAIDGATKATFTPTSDLVGLNVGVIVTASLHGYAPASATSATTVVQVQHVDGVKAATVKAGAKKLTLKLAGVTSAPGKVKVYDGKKLIGKATIKNGKLVLKLKKKLHKGKHKLTVKYAGSAQVAKFNKSVKVKVK